MAQGAQAATRRSGRRSQVGVLRPARGATCRTRCRPAAPPAPGTCRVRPLHVTTHRSRRGEPGGPWWPGSSCGGMPTGGTPCGPSDGERQEQLLTDLQGAAGQVVEALQLLDDLARVPLGREAARHAPQRVARLHRDLGERRTAGLGGDGGMARRAPEGERPEQQGDQRVRDRARPARRAGRRGRPDPAPATGARGDPGVGGEPGLPADRPGDRPGRGPHQHLERLPPADDAPEEGLPAARPVASARCGRPDPGRDAPAPRGRGERRRGSPGPCETCPTGRRTSRA